MKKRILIKTRLSAILLLVVVFVAATLSGCTNNTRASGIKFNVAKLELIVEEEREITGSVVTVEPTFAEDKTFTLSSSDDKIATIVDGTKVRAVGQGKATLTATSNSGGFTAECPVYVNYSSIRTMELKTVGEIIQHKDSVSAVVFTAVCNGVPDPLSEVAWTVNGEAAATKNLSDSFTYTPKNEGGVAVVSASIESFNGTTITQSATIKVYSVAIEPVVTFDELLATQELADFKTVAFTVDFMENEQDPEPTIVWSVDGAKMGTEKVFNFKPSKAGVYRISCVVNGYKSEFSGSEFTTITAKGVLVPTKLVLEYDNSYPKMFVLWNDMPSGMDYTVSIVNNATGVNISPNLNTKNASTANLFSGSSVEVSSFINGDSVNIFSTTFSITVKSDGDKTGVFGESDYSAPLVTEKIDTKAKAYLAKAYYNGNENHYMKDESDFNNYFSYMVLWRVEKSTVYLAYNPNMTGPEIFKKALDNNPYTGSYVYISTYNKSTKLLTLDVTYEMDLLPSKHTAAASSTSLDSMMPHINMDKATGVGSSFNFPINQNIGVLVSNTEQLYHVAQNGYRPVPVAGSAAETYYTYAKNVLGYIISPSMTDADIVHAIYDWIMWRVNYDWTVVNDIDKTEDSVKYNAYYIEGVLTDKNYNAVCDGMSKAFALMSNIMGVPSVRVVGDAGSTPATRGGHAWNKAFVNGEWYIFDCTWGDTQMRIDGKITENASHAYMFLIDSQIADTHVETGSNYPRTATVAYNWYDKDFNYTDSKTGNTKSLDFLLSSSGTSLSQECGNLAEYLFGTVPELNKDNKLEYYANFNYNVNDSRSVSDYYGIEIQVHPNIKKDFLTSSGALLSQNPITSAFKAKGYSSGSDYFISATDGIGGSLSIFVYASV